MVIIVCWLGALIGGACTTYNCKKEGQREFDEASLSRNTYWKELSREKDIYYKPDPHAIMGPDPCFYSDGSLKFDSLTGKSYPKGQYYCKSDGSDADWKQAPGNVKRPPKN